MLKNNKFKIHPNKTIITVIALIIVYLVVNTLANSGSLSYLLIGLLVPCCYYVILAMSLNLTVGILGELSLGHAGFMCVGAFSGALFSKINAQKIESDYLRFIIAMIIAAAVAAFFGMIIGIAVLRLKGDYLAIVTLAFGEIMMNLTQLLYIGVDSKGYHFSLKDVMSLNLEEDGEVLLRGAQGITRVPKVPSESAFLIGMVLVIIAYVIISNLINSRTGRAIMSVRDNRIAAEAMGINITKYKLIAFTISAALAGVAGALYSHNIFNVVSTPKVFGYNMSILILVFVVLGGIGRINGSIIAAVILTLLPEYLRGMQEYRMLIYSVVLIVIMIVNWNPTIKEYMDKYSPIRLLKKKMSTLKVKGGN